MTCPYCDGTNQKDLRWIFVRAASDWSEERFAAGWMGGLEHDLKRAGGAWLVMAQLCGGWPTGPHADDPWLPL